MNEQSLHIHKIVVLVPFRNVRNYIIDCVSSVLAQQYPSYEIYLLDDASTDGTLDELDDEIEHVHKVRNESRLGPMENIYRALVTLPIDDEDIVVLLDGDDYIFGEYAFQLINEKYDNNVLLTYGSYIDNYGRPSYWAPYSQEEFEDLRKAPWKASHLKTFKYKLFRAFLQQDPTAGNFKFYNDDAFYMAASDRGIMIPLMEIAGFENTDMITNIVYCYRLHPNNDHASTAGRQMQLDVENDICNRPALQRMF